MHALQSFLIAVARDLGHRAGHLHWIAARLDELPAPDLARLVVAVDEVNRGLDDALVRVADLLPAEMKAE